MLKVKILFKLLCIREKKKLNLKSQNFITIHVGVSEGTLPQVINNQLKPSEIRT